jgi:hypothetical protein
VPAGPIPNTIGWLRTDFRYSFWPMVFGTTLLRLVAMTRGSSRSACHRPASPRAKESTIRAKSGVLMVIPWPRAAFRKAKNSSARASGSFSASILSQSSRVTSLTPSARSACARFSVLPA